MSNLIDKINKWITPETPASEETIKELQAKTQDLEQQADYAEAEANLLERANKAKKRIKAAKKSDRRLIYIAVGLVILVVIILVISGGC